MERNGYVKRKCLIAQHLATPEFSPHNTTPIAHDSRFGAARPIYATATYWFLNHELIITHPAHDKHQVPPVVAFLEM
jgi:hypothetical protein